jgi:hypothetical protein
VAFLLARSGGSDQAAATEVAELLGRLPLALEQAGAYLRETRLSLTAYFTRLCSHRLRSSRNTVSGPVMGPLSTW